jgi:phage N-6-adenine-methyltransferase
LDQLLRDGRDSHQRIQEIGTGIRKFRKAVLTEWLDQAERLWIAAEHHRLKGKPFEGFAEQIGIDRSSAYELLKLHPNRQRVLTQCRKDNHWPGWEVCASWFKDGASVGAPRTRGALTPTWQRVKVTDDEYGTPQDLFDYYDRIYKFTCDVASSKPLAKCQHYFDKEIDGLKQTWAGVCWMNPPYSDLGQWVKKAYESAQQGVVVVGLLPVFTDAAWFHDYASHGTIELLKGRLHFANRANGYTPFANMICVFRKRSARSSGKRLAITLNGHRLGTKE